MRHRLQYCARSASTARWLSGGSLSTSRTTWSTFKSAKLPLTPTPLLLLPWPPLLLLAFLLWLSALPAAVEASCGACCCCCCRRSASAAAAACRAAAGCRTSSSLLRQSSAAACWRRRFAWLPVRERWQQCKTTTLRHAHPLQSCLWVGWDRGECVCVLCMRACVCGL